ncbi:hypothetical protein [Scytonema millei]|uniref:Uncharacterized protein n=1 Tax=Scytonema millei VB511283 TaxID=1245923 RepID=A0A9X5E4F7_9CYAN|nr:hypothetical protein [Scytonema millei]NHC34987.1 hypothetical protein [Scytonema millei VB511283]
MLKPSARSPIILQLNPPKFVGAGFVEALCAIANNFTVKPAQIGRGGFC